MSVCVCVCFVCCEFHWQQVSIFQFLNCVKRRVDDLRVIVVIFCNVRLAHASGVAIQSNDFSRVVIKTRKTHLTVFLTVAGITGVTSW